MYFNYTVLSFQSILFVVVVVFWVLCKKHKTNRYKMFSILIKILEEKKLFITNKNVDNKLFST